MPYIKEELRDGIFEHCPAQDAREDAYGIDPPEPEFSAVWGHNINTVGALNFAITQLIRTYLDRVDHNYTNYNAVVGVLECAKLELYRRLISKYEDEKIAENGDVY